MHLSSKRMSAIFIKAIALSWCIAFIPFWVAAFLKTREIVIPEFLENYYTWFDNLLDTFFENWFLKLCFGIGFIILFIWIFFRSNKEMGWDDLSKRYSFSMEKIKNLDVEFDFGQSYFNSVYYSGIHVASTAQGLILRHPFPFNYLRSALFIPWNEINRIKITRGLRRNSQNNIVSKIGSKFSPWKYADIKLVSFAEKAIIIPWKSNVKKYVPKDLLVE